MLLSDLKSRNDDSKAEMAAKLLEIEQDRYDKMATIKADCVKINEDEIIA